MYGTGMPIILILLDTLEYITIRVPTQSLNFKSVSRILEYVGTSYENMSHHDHPHKIKVFARVLTKIALWYLISDPKSRSYSLTINLAT
jgi:hypothetical protein